MKNKTIYLILILLLLTSRPIAADQLNLRYTDQSGKLSLLVNQEIKAGKQTTTTVVRKISVSLNTMGGNSDSVDVTINAANGTFTAHGSDRRLGDSHMKEKQIRLKI
jgi:hypothetical protein